MLSLSKKTDYALTALAYLAERSGRMSSAREIASAEGMPVAMLMKILKLLHNKGLLRSERGVKGGYSIAVDLERVSLYDLACPLETGLCVCGSDRSKGRPTHGPLAGLHYRLVRFLKDVKVSDLVLRGRRIDVPVELVGFTTMN